MDETEAFYRTVMAGDDPDEAAQAAVRLGALLAKHQRFTEAEAVLRVAIASENPQARLIATRNLGIVLSETGRHDEAERAFRQVMAANQPFESGAAAVNLAVMLEAAGRLDDAEAAYRTAMTSTAPGVADVAMGNLANLLRTRGDPPGEVEAVYRAATHSDDLKSRTVAQVNLAGFLRTHGSDDEAEGLLREVATSGHPEFTSIAASELGALLMRLDRKEEAVVFLQQAVDSNHPDFVKTSDFLKMSAANLGVTLRDLDRPRDAEAAFRVAAGLGDAGSMMELAKLLERRGETSEAIEWYRTLAERANHPLLIHIGTTGLNRLQGTPGAPSPGVAQILAELDHIVAVLRRHGARFAYLDHQPSKLTSTPRSDRTVMVCFDPGRPVPDLLLLQSEMGPAVAAVEDINKVTFEIWSNAVRTGRLILVNDRPAWIEWLADTRMILIEKNELTDAGPRSHSIDFLSSADVPPGRLVEMLQFVRGCLQFLLDSGRQVRQSPHLANNAGVLAGMRAVFFAAVIGCKRIAHIVIVDNDWTPPTSTVDVFGRLVEHGTIGAPVATALVSAEKAMDEMVPVARSEQILLACLDPIYTGSIRRFVDGVEQQVAGARPRRFRFWRRR